MLLVNDDYRVDLSFSNKNITTPQTILAKMAKNFPFGMISLFYKF